MQELSVSAPEDILGLGYWPIWIIFAILQVVLLGLTLSKIERWSIVYISCVLSCAAVFAIATYSSFGGYGVLEARVLG